MRCDEILPRTCRANTSVIQRPECSVAIAIQVSRYFVPWKRLGDLPGDPLCGWIGSDSGQDQPPWGVGQNLQTIKQHGQYAVDDQESEWFYYIRRIQDWGRRRQNRSDPGGYSRGCARRRGFASLSVAAAAHRCLQSMIRNAKRWHHVQSNQARFDTCARGLCETENTRTLAQIRVARPRPVAPLSFSSLLKACPAFWYQNRWHHGARAIGSTDRHRFG